MSSRKWHIDNKGAVVTTDVPASQLPHGQVEVQVHAICLLPSDSCKSGYSFSGTILRAYEDSTWQIGCKVWGFAANQEYTDLVCVPEWAIHKMKTNLTFLEAATLAGPALLACYALQMGALPATGRPKVLVHGGHTGLGSFIIQVARVMKCDVEVTTPLEHRDRCKELGCTDFVDLQEDVPHGITLASFRGRRERNFHLVVDTLADDTSIYDNIEKFTHEHAKFMTIKDRSVSWTGYFKRIATSVPRDYLYLTNPLTPENASKSLEVVHNLLAHPDFVDIEIEDEYAIEDLATAVQAVEGHRGMGNIVLEVTAPDSEAFEARLADAMRAGRLPVVNTEATSSDTKDRKTERRRLSFSTSTSSSTSKKGPFSLE